MRWLLGLLVVLLGGGLVYVTAELRFGRTVAVALVVAQVLVLPLLLAKLLLPAFRRIDSDARLFESTAGMTVVCALGALALLGFLWRPALARALTELPERHPRVTPLAGRVARAAGRWLTPAALKSDGV